MADWAFDVHGDPVNTDSEPDESRYEPSDNDGDSHTAQAPAEGHEQREDQDDAPPAP